MFNAVFETFARGHVRVRESSGDVDNLSVGVHIDFGGFVFTGADIARVDAARIESRCSKRRFAIVGEGRRNRLNRVRSFLYMQRRKGRTVPAGACFQQKSARNAAR